MNGTQTPEQGLDWTAIRLFLAISRAGSLTEAARRTGLSQPTLGRRLDDLEGRLGVVLLLRGRGGVVATEAGAALLSRAEAMEAAADAFERTATGRRAEPSGDVRVTASRVVAAHLLPPILARLADSDPAIRIDVVASDASLNLLRRDADIAIRMVRPAQPDLIARRIGALALGAFAAPAYVARHGTPRADDLLSHRLAGYDRSSAILDGLRGAGLKATRESFALRTDDQLVYARMVAAGVGVGFLARPIAAEFGLVEVPLPVPIPPLPIWLAAHRDIRTNPAVRRVADMIGNGIRDEASMIEECMASRRVGREEPS